MKVTPTGPTSRANQERHGAAAPRPQRAFLEVIQEGRPRPSPAPKVSPVEPGSARLLDRFVDGFVDRFVDRIGAGEARVDALLEAAARGKTFRPAELIAMQAEVFRYSQTVEVLSRGADRLVGAVKQTLGTQI